jgi:hypothetical protein
MLHSFFCVLADIGIVYLRPILLPAIRSRAPRTPLTPYIRNDPPAASLRPRNSKLKHQNPKERGSIGRARRLQIGRISCDARS